MEDFIPTRGSQVNKNAVANFQTVVFEKWKKKEKPANDTVENKSQGVGARNQNADTDSLDPKRQQEIQMKRARYDVMKFGMRGFEKAKAEDAKVALAVSLGAKPPKNKSVNYKELIADRKKKKEAVKSVQQESGLNRSLIKHGSRSKKKPQKGAGGILGKYGKVQKGNIKKK